MSAGPSTVGCRVKVVDMLHSPARTRAFASRLIGERGTVVSLLRDGSLALVEFDAPAWELPQEARRWPVHWDDLLVYSVEAGPVERQDGLRVALSGEGREAVQHALQLGSRTGLCGVPVYPLPICGLSIPFSPGSVRACPACVHLAATAP